MPKPKHEATCLCGKKVKWTQEQEDEFNKHVLKEILFEIISVIEDGEIDLTHIRNMIIKLK